MDDLRTFLRGIALAMTVACLAACGAEAARYTIGGTVSGLSGAGLVLANNQTESLAVSASGPFAFTPGLSAGASYAVTVSVQPDGQSCAVTQGSGTVGTAAVASVTVTCVAAAPMALLSVTPGNGSTSVSRASAPSMTFSAAMSASGNAAGITLQSAAGTHPLTTSVSGSTLTLTPRRKLLPLTAYTLTAGTALRGAAGEQLPAAVTTTFTTSDATWQTAGLLAPETPDQFLDLRIATNEKGNAIALWMQFDGTRTRMMSRFYSANSGWGPVMEGPASVMRVKGLVLDAMDNGIAVLETSETRECGEEQTCSSSRLYTSRFTPEGGWSDPNLVAAASDSGSADPHIAMNSAGDAVLVWAEDDGGGANIWARRYVVGDGWRSSVKIETHPESASAVQVVMDQSGNAMAIWSQGHGTAENVWASRYAAGSWGTAVQIHTDNAEFGTNARIAMNERGDASAIWVEYDGYGANIWFNSFSATQGWGTAELVAEYAENAVNPAITIDAVGNSLLLWEEFYHEGPAFRMNVWSKRRAATSAWSAATLLLNTSTPGPAELVMDESGNAIAAWSQRDGDRSSLWSNRYIPGIGWGVPALLETDDAGDAALTGLVMNRSGDATVAWYQHDGRAGGGGRMHAFYRRFE